METIEQVYNRVYPDMKKAWGQKDAIKMVAKVYAIQCCEGLKNRLCEAFDDSEIADRDIEIVRNAIIVTP